MLYLRALEGIFINNSCRFGPAGLMQPFCNQASHRLNRKHPTLEARRLSAGKYRRRTKPPKRYTAAMSAVRTLLLCVLSLVLLPAVAQWQWLDASGQRVFSDRGPPADIPEKNILKRPGGMAPASPASATATPAAPAASSTAAAAPTAAASSPPRPVGKDTELQKKKAELEAAEAAKVRAEEQKQAAAKADNCERARRSLNALQSGARIAQINNQGEREFMSDDARLAETRRVQGIVATDCQ